MPIRLFLNGEQFDQETLRILSVAFEQVCVALRLGTDGGVKKSHFANKIIERAKTGERTPDLLCERALTDIRQSEHERPRRLIARGPSAPLRTFGGFIRGKRHPYSNAGRLVCS
jgi:hypothetical protein